MISLMTAAATQDFLCHCITNSYLLIDIQFVLLVIHAYFLYHYSITPLSPAIWWGNKYCVYIQLYISAMQITRTTSPLFSPLQTTRLFYVKTTIKYVKPSGFHDPARYFTCQASPCYPLLHPGVLALYTRV